MPKKEPKKLQVLGKFGKGGVEIPGGAKVGQMIVVKTVDENGKPTEWEAVDNPAYIANVRIDRGRYFFVDGNHETLLNAYNSGATVGLNANGYMYYLFKVVDDNILHFGQIPYTDSDSENAEIPNYYLMVAPDNSITQTIRDIATVGFVNQAIAESTPKKLTDLENDLYYRKELLSLQISGSEMVNNGRQYTFNVDGEHYVNDGAFECMLTIDGTTHVMQCSTPVPDVAPPDFFSDGKMPYGCGASGPFAAIRITDGFLEGGTPDAPAFSCTGTIAVLVMVPVPNEEIVLELKQVQTKMVPVEVLPVKKIRGERLLKYGTSVVNTNPTGDLYYFNFDTNLDVEGEFEIELVFANEAVGGTSNPERSYKTYGKNDMYIIRNSSSMIKMCLSGTRVSTSSGYDIFDIGVFTGAKYTPSSDAIHSTERGFVIGVSRQCDSNNTATALPTEVRIYTIDY